MRRTCEVGALTQAVVVLADDGIAVSLLIVLLIGSLLVLAFGIAAGAIVHGRNSVDTDSWWRAAGPVWAGDGATRHAAYREASSELSALRGRAAAATEDLKRFQNGSTAPLATRAT